MTMHGDAHVEFGTRPRGFGPGMFPPGRTPRALIEARPPSPNTLRKARPWLLTFQPRGPAPARNPLTGQLEGIDPLRHVELKFPSRDTAIAFAERQGLAFDVYGAAPLKSGAPGAIDLEAALVNPAGVFADPGEVLDCPLLTRDQKQDILRRWEWDARLIEIAEAEAMPDRGEPSRLAEVLEALIRLDAEPTPDTDPPPALAMPIPPVPADEPAPVVERIAA